MPFKLTYPHFLRPPQSHTPRLIGTCLLPQSCERFIELGIKIELGMRGVHVGK